MNDLSTPEEDVLIKEELKIFYAVKDYRLAQLREDALWVIAEQLGLVNYLQYFFEHNKSTAEYHNNYHAICVALNCCEGALHQKLSDSEVKTTVLAGIFHDFNHSGGTETDDKNIERAVRGLSSAYITQIPEQLSGKTKTYLTSDEFTQTIQTLAVTKYPYEKSPVTIMQMIIRDADLMQPYEQDKLVLKKQYVGLHTEIERTYPMKFTEQEFANGQQAWLDQNVKWHSTWAKNKAVLLNWNTTKQRLYETMSGV